MVHLFRNAAFVALAESQNFMKSMGSTRDEVALLRRNPNYRDEKLREFIIEKILAWIDLMGGTNNLSKYQRRKIVITHTATPKDKRIAPLRAQEKVLDFEKTCELFKPPKVDQGDEKQAVAQATPAAAAASPIDEWREAITLGIKKAENELIDNAKALRTEIEHVSDLPTVLAQIVAEYLGVGSTTPIPTPPVGIPSFDVNCQFGLYVVQNQGRGGHTIVDATIGLVLEESEERLKMAESPPPNLFVLADTSRSMRGNGGTTTLRQALPETVRRGLPTGTRFGLGTFNDHYKLQMPMEILNEPPAAAGQPGSGRRQELADRLARTGPGSVLEPETGTVILPGYLDGFIQLLRVAIHDRAVGVQRQNIFVSLTDGETETIPDRYIAEIIAFLFENYPELAELIGVYPGAMGNSAKMEQLKNLRGGFGEVFKVALGHPEQLIDVIRKVQKRRGFIATGASVEIIAPKGCVIKHVVGFKIEPGKRRVTLPLPSFLSKEQLQLHVRFEGHPAVKGSQASIRLMAFDPFARVNRNDLFESESIKNQVHEGTHALIEADALYLKTMQELPQLPVRAALEILRRTVIQKLKVFPSDFQPRIIGLQDIVSLLGQATQGGFEEFMALAIEQVAKHVKNLPELVLKLMVREELEWNLQMGGYVADAYFAKGKRLIREPKIKETTPVDQIPEMVKPLREERAQQKSGALLKRTAPERALTMAMRYFETKGVARIAEREVAREILLQEEPDLPYLFRFAAGQKDCVIMVMRNHLSKEETFEQMFLTTIGSKGEPRLVVVNDMVQGEMSFTPEELLLPPNVDLVRGAMLAAWERAQKAAQGS